MRLNYTVTAAPHYFAHGQAAYRFDFYHDERKVFACDCERDTPTAETMRYLSAALRSAFEAAQMVKAKDDVAI